MANTNKEVLFLPPSDTYAICFLYLFYILIKLYYPKALSNQALSWAPDWIFLLWRPWILASLHGSATTFHLGGDSSGQDKDAWSSSSLFSYRTHFLLYFTNSMVCLCEWMTHPAQSTCGALPCGFMVTSHGLWQIRVAGLKLPTNAKRQPWLIWGTHLKWANCVDWTLLFGQSFWCLWPFQNSLELEVIT